MSTVEWHLDDTLARGYAEGRVTSTLAASVEQHLVRCAACRDLIAPAVDSARLDAVWNEIVETVQSPRPGPLERALRAARVDEGTARLVAVTPSLRGAWLTGVVVVLALAVLAANASPNGVALFMALAPVLPVAGVALAFGPAADPTHEIASAAPYSPVRLLALRSALVVAATLVPVAAMASLLPGDATVALGWLLPALALTLGTVALATRFAPHLAAAALALLWVALVIPGIAAHHDPYLATQSWVQLASLAAAAAAVAVLHVRRHDLPELFRRTA